MENLGSYMAMVVIQLAYGGSNILIKLALDKGLNQLVFVVYRHIVAMLLLCPFAYLLERKQRPSLSLASAVKIFFITSLGTTVYLNLYYAGLLYTSATVASALSNVVSSLTMLVSVLLGMETVELACARGRAKVIGTVLSIVGSLTYTFWKGDVLFNGFKNERPFIRTSTDDHDRGSGSKHENWVKGSMLILTSDVAWSMWLILQDAVYKMYPARLSLNVLICFFAALQSCVLALLWETSSGTKMVWKLGWDIQLLTVCYCGIVISALVNCLQTWCICKNGPVFASMFTPLVLVIVGVFSAVFFSERLHVGSLVGALIIIIGLYFVLWGKKTNLISIEKASINDDIESSIPEINHSEAEGKQPVDLIRK